jgi:hypothetical protein
MKQHHVSIPFFATLSKFTPDNHKTYPVADEATVMTVSCGCTCCPIFNLI